ncbi:MAG TPA: helix-turn-helix domain-containing protein [Rhizomicrobium sp.]|nr:helix-turn-helix domain-containing protein [Rhizomicrobium sp.]
MSRIGRRKNPALKVTREKTAENRAKLVQAAARLFRERGIDGVGVAEICEAAGLTHGALYAQFPSKEALAAEAFDEAFARGYPRMKTAGGRLAPSLRDYLEFLISPQQRDNLGGCPLTASASEVARKDETLSASFSRGFEQMVAVVESAIDRKVPVAERRDRALTIIAAEIGVIAVARAAAKSRPDLSNRVVAAARRVLTQIGDAPQRPKRTRRKRR